MDSVPVGLLGKKRATWHKPCCSRGQRARGAGDVSPGAGGSVGQEGLSLLAHPAPLGETAPHGAQQKEKLKDFAIA